MSCLLVSFGHSTKPLDDLVRLIKGAGIAVVCDIRRFPRSRRHPQFGREHLERELPSNQVEYEWLGTELGGFREGGYEAWMATEDFARGIARLEDIASHHTTGFMCSEGMPTKCHRRFVARALSERGHGVSHLLPDGRIVAEETPLSPPGP